MTTPDRQPTNYSYLLIVIGILIGLLIFAGYILLSRGVLVLPEKVQVTRLVTAETTRLVPVRVQVTRLVTPAVPTAPPAIPAPVEPTAILDSPLDVSLGVPLPEPLALHSLTRLQDGRVLIAGGSTAPNIHSNAAWIFDPSTNEIYPVAPLHTPRHEHSATLLPDGRVLVVGGYNQRQQWLTDAEVYDPVADTWTVIPPIYSHGVQHSATLLRDGRVLVVGGSTGDNLSTNRVEIFNPQTNSWTEVAALKSTRASQSAQLLLDGRVLLAGGDWDEVKNDLIVDGNGVIYDPLTNRWSATGPMVTPRVQADSVRLPDGRVLVTGGILAGVDPPEILSSSEIYNPATNAWTAAAPLGKPRYDFVLGMLLNGQAVAIGGSSGYEYNWPQSPMVSEIEIYDAATDRWGVAGSIDQPTVQAAATLLMDGRLWVTGGQSTGNQYSLETWLIGLATP